MKWPASPLERGVAAFEEGRARTLLAVLSGPVLVAVDGRLVSEMDEAEIARWRRKARECRAKREGLLLDNARQRW